MTQDDHVTHRRLVEQLRVSIARLREDVEARADPVLAEIANALELIVDMTTHVHDHAVDNRDRIEKLEARVTRKP